MAQESVSTTQKILKDTMKSLLKKIPLKDITVSTLSKNAFVSRKVFYVYFRDKFDLIERIFYDDIIESMQELRKCLPRRDHQTALLVLERFYKSFYDNRDFYARLVKGKGQYWFRDRITFHLTEFNMNLTSTRLKDVPPEELEYMSYFFAAAQTMLLTKWLSEKCPLPPRQMAEYYAKWGVSYWNTLEGSDPEKA
jgi:AcrR family transcriptional regulator